VPTRSVPAALVDLAKAFAALRVRWYVFGAQAVIAAGAPRLTDDIDITVELPRAGAKDLALDVARRRVAELGELVDDATLLATFDRIVGRRKKR